MNHYTPLLISPLIQDAFTLGLHWIYDTDEVARLFNQQEPFFEVMPNSYHKGKVKGDFTHYGDQALWLTSLILENPNLSVESYHQAFKDFMATYKGYKDHATKETLANIEKGLNYGSSSSELAGVSKIGPILYAYQNNKEQGIKKAVELVMATHQDAYVGEITQYVSEVVYALENKPLLEALQECAENKSERLKKDLTLAKSQVDNEPVDVIKRFGQSCDSSGAFPSVLYLLFRYQHSTLEMFNVNVLAGGDSAARAMVLAIIMATITPIPLFLLHKVNQKEQLLKFLKQD